MSDDFSASFKDLVYSRRFLCTDVVKWHVVHVFLLQRSSREGLKETSDLRESPQLFQYIYFIFISDSEHQNDGKLFTVPCCTFWTPFLVLWFNVSRKISSRQNGRNSVIRLHLPLFQILLKLISKFCGKQNQVRIEETCLLFEVSLKQ